MLPFGQRDMDLIQLGWHVESLDEAMATFTRRLKVGPWFVLPQATPPGALYRGQHTNMTMRVAFGFLGTTQYELIQQTNDAPSVYRDMFNRTGRYGLHHWGLAAHDMDGGMQTFRAEGRDAQFYGVIPGLTRLAYFDTTDVSPVMTELIEWTQAAQDFLMMMYMASCNWNGDAPVRYLE